MGKKILLDFFNKHKISYMIGIFFMLLTSYIQTLFPKVLGDTVDILKEDHFRFSSVYTKIGYILLIAIGTFASTHIWRNMVMGNGRKLECDLREKLFDHFLILSPEFYIKRKAGDLIAYAINDINAVRMTFGPATAMAINGVVICAISIYSMTRSINIKVTLLALIPVPIIVFFMFHIGKLVRKRFKKVQENFSLISDRVQENISGIRVIKAYVQEDKEVEKFETLNSQMAESNMDMIRISAYLSPMIELCFTISFVLNLIIGGNMVLDGTISLGKFVAFNGYLTMIINPVISIGRIMTIFQRGMASLGRLNEIFTVTPDIKEPEHCIKTSVKGPIEINNLSFSYSDSEKEVLKDINLSIPDGCTLGIVGKMGSGKTTLINLLLKLYNVPSGKIYFDGTDINQCQLTGLRNSFGFVPQDNFLFHTSILDNIRFFKDIYSDEEVEEAAKNCCVYDSIKNFPDGFHTILGEKGINISGGQKQRISIARALLKNPDILILDDALSAIDTITESEIIHNLKKVRENKTTIIVALRISAVMNADKIIVLDDGKIIEQGTHSELLEKKGAYYDIYMSQHRYNKFESQAS